MNQYFENNNNLKSKLRKISYQYQDYVFTFNSDLGVFSKDKIDEGSKLLLETYFKYGEKDKKILDVGCGIGFLGIGLSRVMNADVDMIDINNRAIHLTEMNIKENKIKAKVWISNIYEKVENKYDCIITNPPIRAGKRVYLTILNDAFNYLNDDGELWFVMRTNHGVKTVIKNLSEKYNVDILDKSCGFYVVKVKR
jgi:16S rRNA (guanine1207-N2)-methyltransferase